MRKRFPLIPSERRDPPLHFSNLRKSRYGGDRIPGTEYALGRRLLVKFPEAAPSFFGAESPIPRSSTSTAVDVVSRE